MNSGVGRANKVIRRVCGLPDTAGAAALTLALGKRDPKAVIGAVNAERLKFLQGLKTWPTFGKGWGARVQSVNAAALKMADLKDAPIPSVLPPVADAAPGKGEVPKPDTGKIVVGTGGSSGAVVGATWWDWVATHPVQSIVIAAVTLIAVVIIAEFLASRWQAYRQHAPVHGLIPVPETK